MRIAIVTDAWDPQVNGVVTTYRNVARQLSNLGHEVCLLTPEGFNTIPCPSYPSIRLAVFPKQGVWRRLAEFRGQAIHIATEGPLGHAARAFCVRHKTSFSTSFHTQFPEYLRLRAPVPIPWSYAYLRRFHARAKRTLVATPSQLERLRGWGFKHLAIWDRGVDVEIFRPTDKNGLLDVPRPIAMYMGRIAVEKNIEDFLRLDLSGSKIVIGDGPDREKLSQRFPQVRFLGQKLGRDLAAHLACADVLVFPSRTDTYGLVMLEAMACGVPVAAYPVTGPTDLIRQGVTGSLDQDLKKAVTQALQLNPDDCVAFVQNRSWKACAERFLACLVVGHFD
ncbi:MAG: glycosyltransferase family 4 protein [Gammaproteobacteria bacterium]